MIYYKLNTNFYALLPHIHCVIIIGCSLLNFLLGIILIAHIMIPISILFILLYCLINLVLSLLAIQSSTIASFESFNLLILLKILYQ